MNAGYNASWNTEANTRMCHIFMCLEVIFVLSHSSCLACKNMK